MTEKQNKMFPIEIKLEICPKCKKNGVSPNEKYKFCLLCDWVSEKFLKDQIDTESDSDKENFE